MILFFKTPEKSVIATQVDHQLNEQEIKELCWLYSDATLIDGETLDGFFVGPRREMITPWSTNAVEITQNMGLKGIKRIEEYFPVSSKDADYDPMLQRMYTGLNQNIFTVNIQPEPIKHVANLEEYNEQEGLALSPEEIEYLHKVEQQLGRPLTDSEIFGFAQINSEHCRHKMFGGVFITVMAAVGVNPLLIAAMLPCICGVMSNMVPPMAPAFLAGVSLANADFSKTVKNGLWWIFTQYLLEIVVLMGWLPVFGL